MVWGCRLEQRRKPGSNILWRRSFAVARSRRARWRPGERLLRGAAPSHVLALCLPDRRARARVPSGRVWPRPEFGAAAGSALQSGKRARTDQSLKCQQCSRDVKNGGPGDTREYHVGEAAPRRACARSTGSIAPLSNSCHSRPLLAPCWALPSGAPSKTSTADGSRYSSRPSCTSEPPSAAQMPSLWGDGISRCAC